MEYVESLENIFDISNYDFRLAFAPLFMKHFNA